MLLLFLHQGCLKPRTGRRYEELKKQLLEAQSQAEAEDEEAELARAAAAVARLTAPAAPSEGAAKDAFWSAQRVRSRLFGRNKSLASTPMVGAPPSPPEGAPSAYAQSHFCLLCPSLPLAVRPKQDHVHCA